MKLFNFPQAKPVPPVKQPAPGDPSLRRERCTTCRFYVLNSLSQVVAQNQIAGQCWRNPPVPVPMASQSRVHGATPEIFVIAARPPVGPNDWCGLYEPADPVKV